MAVWKAMCCIALTSFSSVFKARILSAYFRNRYGLVLDGDVVAHPSLLHFAFAMDGFPCRVMEDRAQHNGGKSLNPWPVMFP